MTVPPDDPVRALAAKGLYVEAAQLAASEGNLARAVQLLERVFRFAEAIPFAVAAGDVPLAVRLALDARDAPEALRLAASIPDDAPAELVRASETLAARGHLGEAAALAERAGAYDRAALHHERAGALLEAARVHERSGRLREAGRLYEKLLEIDASSGDVVAAAQLGLGRLLGRLGRHREAARALQRAASRPTTELRAARLLCGELLALGLPIAADEIARRARRLDPTLPDRGEELAALEHLEPVGTAVEAPSRFSHLRLLGAGALGRVYAAEDRLSGRKVALKVLAVGAGSELERSSLRRFVREAQATRRLRHPNIVSLLELDEAAGVLVLELLPGGTLAEAIATKGRLPPSAVRRLGIELLAGLSAAHEAGVVHRDVKPDNVFFDAAGNAKLADFGAAHLLDFGQTQTGGFIGTLAYLSPEQISGGAIDFAADLYGLGVTLFQALTGQLPFPGPDFVAQHLAAEPPPPSLRRPALMAAHDDVIRRALAKAPSDRFASARHMAAAIRAWPDQDPKDEEPQASGIPASFDRGETGPLVAAVELGRTARGRLLEAHEGRVGRLVLAEELDEPLDDAALAELARVAAAGGPHVQRLLAIGANRQRVLYESVAGAPLGLDELGADEAQLIAEVGPALAAAGRALGPETVVVRTAGGPVVLVCPAVPDLVKIWRRAE